MRAVTQPREPVTAQQHHHVVSCGNVHRRPTPSTSPFQTASPYAPSPSSSSSASSHRSSASSGSTSARPAVAHSIPLLQDLNDDSDLWASIRLASSPSSGHVESASRGSTLYGRQSSRAVSRPQDETMLPLVIDDFSQERMGRVPTVRPTPPLVQQTKASSLWAIGRRTSHTTTTTTNTTKSEAPLVRAQSLNQTELHQPNAHDITLMDHRVFVARDQWVPHRDRRACVVCDRDFGMLRKKHSCRMCGDVVCSRCSLFKNVKLPGVVGESKARVCSRCFLQYRQRVLVKTLSADDVGGHADIEPIQNHDTHYHDHHQAKNNSSDESTGGDEVTYDTGEDLPSADDVMRRTAAKVTGSKCPIAAVTPMDFDSRRTQHKPVSLLAPELMASMYRESSTRTAAAALNQQNPNHIYGRGPSMVLLSPASTYDLLDMQLFDVDHTQSFSSTISTVSSSLSSSSTTSTTSSTRSATDEELAAAMRARELENEVESSRERIKELERTMQEQENKKTELSLEQQKQLSEARELIEQLQQQLKQQEQHARNAAMARDSICLTNLRQLQHAQAPGPDANRQHRRDSIGESESEALRQKLRLLERQLQHAGINVAEIIPYAVAKQRIIEISRRMAEISDAEAVMKLQNPKGVVALRREYYVLEQDMERFHTALLMSDEYIEEQATKEREWELDHAAANAQALCIVRSALPVDISRLSEQTLRTMITPSGKSMSADLARRFKRTNVLQLLRVSPQTIMRMHPSVIESYRTAGLTLVERRALHAALKDPVSEWRKQARDESAQKKLAWFTKLKDAFMQALVAYEQHIVQHHTGGDAQCPFIGKMCVVRAEQAVTQLYAANLGFPEGSEYYQQEIIKSDPEGAGEKALVEAKTQAMAAAALSARQSGLKDHYGLRNVRLVTMALAAMEEMDAAIERIRTLDNKAAGILRGPLDEEQSQVRWWRLCEELVNEVRELTLQLARRAGLCLTGKRDRNKDDQDIRSPYEARAGHSAATYLDALVYDMEIAIASMCVPASATQLKNALPRIRELLADVHGKNDELLAGVEGDSLIGDVPVVEADEDASFCVTASPSAARVPWKERTLVPTTSPKTIQESVSTAEKAVVNSPRNLSRRLPTSSHMPRGSILLDAIRAKRSVTPDAANESSADPQPPTVESLVAPAVTEGSTPPMVKKAIHNAPKANDMFAAIRAKRSAVAQAVDERVSDVAPMIATPTPPSGTPVRDAVKTTEDAPKATNLLAAIRARKAKANALSAVAPVDRTVASA